MDVVFESIRAGFLWGMEHVWCLNLILSVLIVLFQRKNPTAVWAWLLVFYFVPIFGFVLYLLIGRNFHQKYMFRTKEIEREMYQAIQNQRKGICERKIKLETSEQKRFKSLIFYNLNAGKAVLTDNNRVQVFVDGREKYEALFDEISKAKEYIHIQYYIIKNDELWQGMKQLLERKANQGIEVRILFDGMGCRTMQKKEWKNLNEAGIRTAEFFPALWGKLQLRINYRNHRKIVVIDGRIGFVGGLNIGKEYLGLEERFGYWRDTHVCIEGAAVTSLAIRFAQDWNYAAGENLFMKDQLFQIPDYLEEGMNPVQIISSGPDSKNRLIRNNYLRMIHLARKSIYIQTPYFIPDEEICEALSIASQSGIDVRIMVPCKPDHPFVYWTTYAYLGEMIEVGAKCYMYENGFLHAKCMCVDGMVSCLGTANMDMRSFSLNFEVNAVIYSADTTEKLEKAFEKDIDKSRLITQEMYRSRTIMTKVKEQFCRLFAPLL